MRTHPIHFSEVAVDVANRSTSRLPSAETPPRAALRLRHRHRLLATLTRSTPTATMPSVLMLRVLCTPTAPPSRCTHTSLAQMVIVVNTYHAATTVTVLVLRIGSSPAVVPRFSLPGPTTASTLVPVSVLRVRLCVKCDTRSFFSDPANGIGMKIWQCFDGLAAQQWYYTPDQRIALDGGSAYPWHLSLTSLTQILLDQCIDLTNGSTADGNQVQTWKCTTGDNNQRWTF